jgi:hypothetical protein
MATINTGRSVRPTIDLQSLGADLHVYGESDDPAMRNINPSIAWNRDAIVIAIRSCNFGVERHGKWYLRDGGAYPKTDVLLSILDPYTLGLEIDLYKLKISDNAPTRTKVAGLEDVRLFSRKDGLHAIGFESDRVTRSLHNRSAALAEYLIKDGELIYLRTLEKPDMNVVEKNWSPTDVESDRFDFTYSPTQVWKDGKVIGEKYTGIIHGGTQLLKQEDGTYISIVHDKVIDPMLNRPHIYDKYVYRHYLAKHNEDGIITSMTPAFNFGTHENIEFASGMVENNGDLIISLGIRDAKFAIARVRKDKLTELL